MTGVQPLALGGNTFPASGNVGIGTGAPQKTLHPVNNNTPTIRFEQVAGNVDRGLVVAQDGLRLAAHAGRTPDMTALLRDATTAMRDVHAFLEGLPTPPGRAPTPMMVEALRATAQAAGISGSGS